MRKLIGWALGMALVGLGMACGGSSGTSSPAEVSSGGNDGLPGGDGGLTGGDGEQPGDFGGACNPGDEPGGDSRVCLACKATGGGTFYLDGVRVTFGLNALPANDDAGFEGEGIAAKGHIEMHLHAQGSGGNVFGKVDTLLSCEDLGNGTTSATFSGDLRGGGRFLVTVTDSGEPGRADTISFTDDVAFGPHELVEGGNLQVRGFDRCVNECPEGMCWCDYSQECLPCPPPPPPPPPPSCDAGLCWCPETSTCEPCYTPL